jgi:hypothetical protein
LRSLQLSRKKREGGLYWPGPQQLPVHTPQITMEIYISDWIHKFQNGAAWLSMVRRGSAWCGVAQLWCGVAQLWCGVAQLVARRLAVRQARVRFSARHHREVFPTEHTSNEEMERVLGEW